MERRRDPAPTSPISPISPTFPKDPFTCAYRGKNHKACQQKQIANSGFCEQHLCPSCKSTWKPRAQACCNSCGASAAGDGPRACQSPRLKPKTRQPGETSGVHQQRPPNPRKIQIVKGHSEVASRSPPQRPQKMRNDAAVVKSPLDPRKLQKTPFRHFIPGFTDRCPVGKQAGVVTHLNLLWLQPRPNHY